MALFPKSSLAIETQQGEVSSAPYQVNNPFGNEVFSFSFQENGGLSISIPPEMSPAGTTETAPIVLQGIFSTSLLTLYQGLASSNFSAFSLLSTDLYLALIVAAFVMANDQPASVMANDQPASVMANDQPASGSVSSADFNNAMSSYTLSNQLDVSSMNSHGDVLHTITLTLYPLMMNLDSIKVTLSDWNRKTIRVVVSVGGTDLTYYIKRPNDDLDRLLALLSDHRKPENRDRGPDEDPDPDMGMDSGCGSCFWSLCCWCCNWGSSSESKPINQGSIQYGSNQQRVVKAIPELELMPSTMFSDPFKAVANKTGHFYVNEMLPVKNVAVFQLMFPEAVSAW
ncbi:hypothetical protein [Endozoicomonas numazuensis]|nr:hypothetical protein [Endozoicomonas numazuensis]